MLDIKFIRDNVGAVKAATKGKGVDVDVDEVLKLDNHRRSQIAELENLKASRNKLSAQTKGGKPSDAQVKEGKELKTKIVQLEKELKTTDEKYHQQMLLIPNILHESVPLGEDESDNVPIKTVGEIPEFDFDIKDHEELGKLHDIIDIETGTYASGSRFYYLKNDAVLLEFALVQWLMQKYVSKGFTPVITPELVRAHMLEATGFFPADKNEIYSVNPGEDDLFLIGTSEVTLAGLHMQNQPEEDQLPLRYVGFSSCFRREAGSYGKDTKGIFRVHQFDKVEMYSFCHPDKSWEEHDFLLSIEEEILQELELPYQVVNICTGDLGAPAAKKYDCEVWLPTQKRYRELTSCSNTTDFQSRRGGIKYRTNGGKLEYLHTLNGTAMAFSRTLIAILENFQQADGSIMIPKVLVPFFGKEKI